MDSPHLPKTKWLPTPEFFNRMLLWLDVDHERAGVKYEEIRTKLISRFRQLGSTDPEHLADETTDRVMQKLPQILADWKGEPVAYFFSVAFYVHQEHRRRPLLLPLPPVDFSNPSHSEPAQLLDDQDVDELLDECLKQCLDQQTKDKREMILQYYLGERDEKIRRRKELAAKHHIKLPNLRLKAQRVRTDLKKCVVECMNR